jgi:hypothetical protein
MLSQHVPVPVPGKAPLQIYRTDLQASSTSRPDLRSSINQRSLTNRLSVPKMQTMGQTSGTRIGDFNSEKTTTGMSDTDFLGSLRR